MFNTEQRGLVIEETKTSLAPILIALLNLYVGLATGIAGFVLDNTVLIVAGVALVACRSLLVNMITKAMKSIRVGTARRVQEV